MKQGKHICETLKSIRREIARANDIDYTPTECTHQGDCAGTCPKCESETRWLERQLRSRHALGKAVTIAGLSLAMSGMANASSSSQVVSPREVPVTDSTEVSHRTMGMVYIAPPPEIQQIRLDSIYSEVDEEALFPDGNEALDSLIKSQLFIPDDILQPIKEIGGTVKARCIVKCVVERDGTISDAMIEKSTTAPIFDEEALRVVKSLPQFYPATIYEIPVRSWKLIPVEFVYDFSHKD